MTRMKVDITPNERLEGTKGPPCPRCTNPTRKMPEGLVCDQHGLLGGAGMKGGEATAGPWTVAKGDVAVYGPAVAGKTVIEPGIGEVWGLGRTPEANARLIAAAPQLRDALRAFTDCYVPCPDCSGSGLQNAGEEEYRCRTCLGAKDVLGVYPQTSQFKPVDRAQEAMSILQAARAALRAAEGKE